MNAATSFTLRYCLFAGIALVVAGLIFSEQDYGDKIMWVGLLILIASPFIGILTTYYCLAAEKDRKWAEAATILIVIILIVLTASLLRN